MNKNLSFKKFVILLAIILPSYALYHLIIWNLYTSQIFDRKDKLYIGDIGRISYQLNSLHPRKLEYTLNKKHLNHAGYNNEKIDILTVGDSFSNAGAGGLNPYYQDYLADIHNINVLNIIKMSNGRHALFESILVLYNNGWLKKHQPKLIIIESSERDTYNRFAKKFDFSMNKFDTPITISGAKTKELYIPSLLTINTANYKLPYYTAMYMLKNRAFKRVAKIELNSDFFTANHYENQLLFHYDDIKKLENNQQKVELINNNFNKLALLLKSLNIKLAFMPAVDKYDLYSNYILNNPYPKNNFFDIIRPMKKDYYFIDTKAILSPMLKDGVKDLYYSDDTHWSYKASKEIARNIKL